MQELTYLARSPHHYNTLDLKKGVPELREDGMRTDGGKGSYEWWYFDAHLEDQSKIVIVFYTKAMTDVNKPLNAYATLNIDYIDGTKIERYLPATFFKASREACDVHIGRNYFKGDLKQYYIHLEDHDFKLDIEFSNTSESWRPETGHVYFGKKYFFAWLVPVPKGHATISYTFPDKNVHTRGVCYHDHNWGNKSMHKLINYWYWSRSELGPYTIIACQIIPVKKFGNRPIHLTAILKDDKIVADNSDCLQLIKTDLSKNHLDKKPIANHLLFRYEEEDFKLELNLSRQKNIMETYLIQKDFSRKLAKLLTGFNGAYFRITGEARLEIFEKQQLVESFENHHSIWELMFFGNPY